MKAITTIALATLATACGTVDPPGPPAPEPDTHETTGPDVRTDDVATADAAKLASTCQELVDTGTPAVDGDYELHIGSDPNKPWMAYCADMASSPKEYLPLVFVLGDHNYSQYTAGGSSPGSNVRTSYLRLRIDPATLMVDTGDQTFAISHGSLFHSMQNSVTSMPFGVAMSCDGSPSGLADIDLRGTSFTIGAQFAAVGWGSSGTATVDTSAAQATLNGGGGCGWNAEVNAPYNPFNAAHGSLQLVYTP